METKNIRQVISSLKNWYENYSQTPHLNIGYSILDDAEKECFCIEKEVDFLKR